MGEVLLKGLPPVDKEPVLIAKTLPVIQKLLCRHSRDGYRVQFGIDTVGTA